MPVGWRWASQGTEGISSGESASAARAVGMASLDIATLLRGEAAAARRALRDGEVVVRG